MEKICDNCGENFDAGPVSERPMCWDCYQLMNDDALHAQECCDMEDDAFLDFDS